eukprot:TRINITY_DN22078_c0_g1_i1.p1 TRINITY_DN22078_c0_g1~~TRINITY_DN22078_c0_g1_i1.p1  ORF type:complete len:303 (-),score=4.62 TRINITY_DN22078_c0_g1_i1:61-969(-)
MIEQTNGYSMNETHLIEQALSKKEDQIVQGPNTENLRCPIHLGVFINPVVDDCGHTFCSSCINEYINIRNQCPISKKRITRLTTNYTVKSIIDDLRSVCLYAPDCSWEGKHSEVMYHIVNNCLEHPTPCKGCQIRMKRKVLPKHMEACQLCWMECEFCQTVIFVGSYDSHMSSCDFAPQECPERCGEILPPDELSYHLYHSCPYSEVVCPFKVGGCGFIGRRIELEEHMMDAIDDHKQIYLNTIGEISNLEQAQNNTRLRQANMEKTLRKKDQRIKTLRKKIHEAKRAADELAQLNLSLIHI